jgi:hypothetical protein
VHTKQKLVWWKHKLTETAPHIHNPSFNLTTNSFILLHSTSPLCRDNQAPLHLPLPILSLPPNSLSHTQKKPTLEDEERGEWVVVVGGGGWGVT